MDESIYDWRRFWSRRDGEIDLSDDGFLVDPNSLYVKHSGYSAVDIRSSAVDFKSIAHFAALGLLGEPGIGKSTGLKREYRLAVEEIGRAGDRSLWVDLAAYGSDTLLCDRVFKSPQFLAWERSEGQLYLFLDSLDDGMLRIGNLPTLLIDIFQTLPVDRLSIRIACRTADWPSTLESGLPRLWGAANVGIFEMLPLRRDDAAQMVTGEKVDPQLFFDAIEHAGAGPFANRPITLRALLKKFKRNEPLSDRQADLYLDLCRILCEEHSEHRTDASNVGHLSAAQRLVIASRFASAVVFGARAGICMGPYRGDTPPHDVQLDHLLGREGTAADANFEIDGNAARETLGLTGLFSSRGAKRLGFAHQSFAEFLAAHYLFLHKLSTIEILGLLRHPGGSGKIIPQLRETAAWTGSLIPDVLQGILCTDPKSLLQSSVNIADFPARRQLAQAALRLYDSEELVDERIAHDAARRLWHPNLHEDLEPFISDKTKGITVRRVAIALAALCPPAKLGAQLVGVALDKEDVHPVRVAAAFAISRMDDSAIRAALRPLITHAPEEDPADELRGCALSALWPDHLNAAELLAALRPPQCPNVFGMYWHFSRSDIAKHIGPEEFMTAFLWAEDCLNGHVAAYPLASIALDILVRAVDLYNWPEFSEGIAEMLLQQARSYSPDDRPVLTRLCANRAAKERIVGLILDQARGPSDAVVILHHGLVNQEDVPWLLSRLDVCPSRDSTVVAFLVASLLDPTDVPTFDRVLLKRKTNAVLARELEPRLAAVIFNSIEEQEARRIDALRDGSSRAPAPPPVPLGKLIAAMDDSDPHAFMGVCSGICKHCRSVPDLKEEPLPGWNDLNSPLREQLVLAAVRFVREGVPPAPQWLGRGSTPYVSIFGYWALRLLYLQAPETFKSLSGDVWGLWTSSVVGFPFFGDAESYSAILRTAYERASAQFLEAFECLIDGENDCPLPTLLSSRLLILWNECIADTLRSNLTSDKLRPPCFESVVAALLEHGDLPTRELAASLAGDGLAPEGVDHQRACIVARHLLFHYPEIAWEIVWPALQANKELAQELLSPLAYAGRELMARNPDLGWNTVWPVLQSCSELAVEFFSGLMGYDADLHGSTHLLLKRLSEPQLAEFYISLARHAPTPRGQDAGIAITPARDLGFAKQIVIGELEGRGTAEACQEICRLLTTLSEPQLKWSLVSAEEKALRDMWAPLSPQEIIARACDAERHRTDGDNNLKPTEDQPTAHSVPSEAQIDSAKSNLNKGASSVSAKKGRGFPPNESNHRRVAKAAFAVGANWSSDLPSVCRALQNVGADFPESLRDEEFGSWEEVAEFIDGSTGSKDREKVRLYVAYRVKWVRSHNIQEGQ